MASSRRSQHGMSISDVDLIAEIKRGSVDAFSALVERHQRSVINFFYHFSWDRQIAEDCTQEVFVKLYTHLGTYEPRAKFTTFLYRVARNLWIDKVRARKLRPVSLESPLGFGEEKTLGDRIPGRAESPLETLTRQETQAVLRHAIDMLPEEQRMVVILSELEGLPYQEIGEVLDVPVGTVKSRMFTAMRKLRDLLADV